MLRENVLWSTGIGFIIIGVFQLALVLERYFDARWQVEKFEGYGSEGYITLSWETGITYIIVASVIAISSLGGFVFIRKKNPALSKIYLASGILFLSGLAVYVPLAFSSMNRWLP